LKAPPGETEARDDLVKDQQDAFSPRRIAKGFKKPMRWGDNTHVSRDRFDDDAGDVVAPGFQATGDGMDVVVGQGQG